jgi:hypothetical protein
MLICPLCNKSIPNNKQLAINHWSTQHKQPTEPTKKEDEFLIVGRGKKNRVVGKEDPAQQALEEYLTSFQPQLDFVASHPFPANTMPKLSSQIIGVSAAAAKENYLAKEKYGEESELVKELRAEWIQQAISETSRREERLDIAGKLRSAWVDSGADETWQATRETFYTARAAANYLKRNNIAGGYALGAGVINGYCYVGISGGAAVTAKQVAALEKWAQAMPRSRRFDKEEQVIVVDQLDNEYIKFLKAKEVEVTSFSCCESKMLPVLARTEGYMDGFAAIWIGPGKNPLYLCNGYDQFGDLMQACKTCQTYLGEYLQTLRDV